MTNDAVSIILFNTVEGFMESSEGFDYLTPFKIIGNFLLLGFVSILIGLCFGLLGTYLLKRIRLLTVSSIRETLLLYIFAYLAYSFSEIFGMSSIISLLTAGITLAHYCWYNLSP